MSVELVDYLAIAVEVTGLSVETITRAANLDLADSALHAPAAGFGDAHQRRGRPRKGDAALSGALHSPTSCAQGLTYAQWARCETRPIHEGSLPSFHTGFHRRQAGLAACE